MQSNHRRSALGRVATLLLLVLALMAPLTTQAQPRAARALASAGTDSLFFRNSMPGDDPSAWHGIPARVTWTMAVDPVDLLPRLRLTFVDAATQTRLVVWANPRSAPDAPVRQISMSDYTSVSGANTFHMSARLSPLMMRGEPLSAAQRADELQAPWFDQGGPDDLALIPTPASATEQARARARGDSVGEVLGAVLDGVLDIAIARDIPRLRRQSSDAGPEALRLWMSFRATREPDSVRVTSVGDRLRTADRALRNLHPAWLGAVNAEGPLARTPNGIAAFLNSRFGPATQIDTAWVDTDESGHRNFVAVTRDAAGVVYCANASLSTRVACAPSRADAFVELAKTLARDDVEMSTVLFTPAMRRAYRGARSSARPPCVWPRCRR